MTQTLATVGGATGIIAKLMAESLEDKLQFCKNISKANTEDFKGKNGYAAGQTIYINKPARFIPNTTSFDITSSIQDVVEVQVPLTLNIISNVPVEIDSLDIAYNMELKSLYERVIEPATQAVAQNVESQVLTQMINGVYNLVGTAGSTTYDIDTIQSAKERMNKGLTPKDDLRFLLIDSTAGRNAVVARQGLFQAGSEIAKQYKQGYVGMADSFKWMENELIPVHTNGTDPGTGITLATTSLNGATTVALTGGSGDTLTAGTVITFAGRYAVHPITKTQQNFLAPFVVTALNTASGTAYTGVPISPTIYDAATGKSLQNVSSLPTSGDVVTVLTGGASAAYQQGIAFHKSAARLASVPLVMPKMVEFAEQATSESGRVTISIIRAWDQLKRRMITRVDYLGGLCIDRPEFACRLTA